MSCTTINVPDSPESHASVSRATNQRIKTFLFLVSVLLTPLVAIAQSQSDFSFSTKQLCLLQDDGQVNCTVADGFDRLLPPPDGITLTGQPVCWGSNSFGQTTAPLIELPLTQINAGQNHTCAVDVSGQAVCWGLNGNRQLEPPENAKFVQVDAAFTSSCGILDNGDITCWSTDIARAPAPLTGPFVNLDIEDTGVCGLSDNGEIRCASGDLINPPVNPPPANGPYSDLAATGDAVCGLDSDGLLDCTFFRRGIDDETINSYPIGQQFLAIQSEETGVTSMVASNDPSAGLLMCGERLDGSLQCWGSDSNPLDSEQQPSNSTINSVELDLDARIYGSSSVEIFWSPLSAAQQFSQVEIFRNGELLDTVFARFSYGDRNALPDNTYQIRLVDDTGNVGPLSDPLTVNTETRTVLFNGEAPLTSSEQDSTPNVQDLITNSRVVGLTRGFIVAWDTEPELEALVDRYDLRLDKEFIGFTRSRLYVNTITRIDDRCFEIIAVGADGTLLDVAVVGSC